MEMHNQICSNQAPAHVQQLLQQQPQLWQPKQQPQTPTGKTMSDIDMSPTDTRSRYQQIPTVPPPAAAAAAATAGLKLSKTQTAALAVLSAIEPMLLEAAETPVDSGFSAGSSMQPGEANIGSPTADAPAADARGGGGRYPARAQTGVSSPQQQQQQQLAPSNLRPPLPNRPAAAAAAGAGLGINKSTFEGAAAAAAAAVGLPASAQQHGPEAPAALARGFGSFFLALPEDSNAAQAAPDPSNEAAPTAAAAAPNVDNAQTPQQQQQQQVSPCTPPPDGDDSPAGSHKHQGDCTAVMLGMLDVVVQRFNTQRVSSPSVDGAASNEHPGPHQQAAAAASAAAAAGGEVLPSQNTHQQQQQQQQQALMWGSAEAAAAPAVSDSCSPSNPVRGPTANLHSPPDVHKPEVGAQAPPQDLAHTAAAAAAPRQHVSPVVDSDSFADVFDQDSTDPDEHAAAAASPEDKPASSSAAAATAAAAAAAGLGPVYLQQQQQQQQQSQVLQQVGGAVSVAHPGMAAHVGSVHAQQSVLVQQHAVPIPGAHFLNPRSGISRPTVTTGAVHSHAAQHNHHHQQQQQQQQGIISSPVTSSTWQQPQHNDPGIVFLQQQQQQQQEQPVRSSTSDCNCFGPEFGVSNCTEDPAVTGNTEEDEMLQQVLPQLTAAMEREADAAAAAAAAAAVASTASGGLRPGLTPPGAAMQHSSRLVTGPQVHHMPMHHQQQQQQQQLKQYTQEPQEQQTGSPFGCMDTQHALYSNVQLPYAPGYTLPCGQHSMSLPGQHSMPQHSIAGQHSMPQHSMPGQHSMPASIPPPFNGIAGSYPHSRVPQGLPRYPSHSGTQQQQQQQQSRQQHNQHPAGWGPPSSAGLMQQQQQQQQQHQQQYQQQAMQMQQYYQQQQYASYYQQQQQALPRVHSAPAMPQDGSSTAGMSNAAAAAAGQASWGAASQPMPHHTSSAPGSGYGYLQHISSSGAAAAAADSGMQWGTGAPSAAAAGAMGRSSQDHLAQPAYPQYASRAAENSRIFSDMAAAGAMRASTSSQQGVASNMLSGPTGRTIASLKVTYGALPLSSSRSASAAELSTAAAAAAAAGGSAEKPPVKTGTGRPRGRPRKHPLPAAAAAAPSHDDAAAPASAGASALPQSQQQQQQPRVHWQEPYDSTATAAAAAAGVEPGRSGGSGSSSGSGGSLVLQRKRSSSFSGLDEASPNLKVKLQRASTGVGVPLPTSSGGSSSSGRPTLPVPKPQKKPKGMPKPTIKDGVMVPPPPGPDMAARGWPPFSDLVVGGYFPPGTYNFSCGTVPSVIATVTPNGLIRWKEDTYQSISSFALAVVRTVKPTRQACDGWRECRLKGVKIHEWRAAFLEKRTPPAVPPECIVQQQSDA